MLLLDYVDDRTPIELIRTKYIKIGHFVCQGYDDEIVKITSKEQIEAIIKEIMEEDIGYNVSNSYNELVQARDTL